jgi:hypothetical protein
MTDNIMLAPPLAFLIVLASMLLLLRLLKGLSFKCKPNDEACTKSYACGEDVPTSMIQPDYSAFFPFAFLFTILHVVALVVAMALIYVAGGITGLVILFRRNK